MSVPGGFSSSFLTGGTNYALPGISDRNQDATLYVGNLDAKVDEELLWEMFIQCGPLTSVVLPRDRVTSCHQGYAFVEYKTTEDAEYAIKILNMVRLFGKPVRCNKSAVGGTGQGGGRPGGAEVGANVFVGGLSPEVDEAYLRDTFSAFGSVTFTKIMRDPSTMVSKGFGFVSFDTFVAADGAIAAMNGQYLGNRPIAVSYSQKKDSGTGKSSGETHGTAAERLLADLRPKAAPLPTPPMMAPGLPGFAVPNFPPPPPPPPHYR